jgi:hypothetical protein
MKQVANITLVEKSTAGNPDKVFTTQTVTIRHQANTSVTGVDGRTSPGRHPTEVEWAGGTTGDLLDITDVIITGLNGDVLVDAEVNMTFEIPRGIPGGVRFFVLGRA